MEGEKEREAGKNRYVVEMVFNEYIYIYIYKYITFKFFFYLTP